MQEYICLYCLENKNSNQGSRRLRAYYGTVSDARSPCSSSSQLPFAEKTTVQNVGASFLLSSSIATCFLNIFACF